MITRTCFICGDKHRITKIVTIGKGKNIRHVCFYCIRKLNAEKMVVLGRVEKLDNMEYGR